MRQRWELLCRVLQLPADVPANVIMASYFNPDNRAKYRGTKTSIATQLNSDLKYIDQAFTTLRTFKTAADLEICRNLARGGSKQFRALIIDPMVQNFEQEKFGYISTKEEMNKLFSKR